MFKYLYDEIKNMEGNVLAIGIDDKLINAIKKNKNISAFEISKSERFSLLQRKKRNNQIQYPGS